MANPNESAPLLSNEKAGMVVYSTVILENNCNMYIIVLLYAIMKDSRWEHTDVCIQV